MALFFGIHRFWLFTAFGMSWYTPVLAIHRFWLLISPSVSYAIHGTLFRYTLVLAIHRFWHELVYTSFGYPPLLAFDLVWYIPHLAPHIRYPPLLAVSIAFGIHRIWH